MQLAPARRLEHDIIPRHAVRDLPLKSQKRHYVKRVLVRTRHIASTVRTDADIEAIEKDVVLRAFSQLLAETVVNGNDLDRLLLHVRVPHPNR